MLQWALFKKSVINKPIENICVLSLYIKYFCNYVIFFSHTMHNSINIPKFFPWAKILYIAALFYDGITAEPQGMLIRSRSDQEDTEIRFYHADIHLTRMGLHRWVTDLNETSGSFFFRFLFLVSDNATNHPQFCPMGPSTA